MPILEAGQIFSESGTLNPLEDHFFKHQVKYTDPPGFCQHVKWSISGDVPKGISIDAGSGLISGYIKWFGEQPSAAALFEFLKEPVKFNGTNYKTSPRYNHQHFDFHFTIKRDVKIKDSNGDCKIPLSETASVFIKEIKMNDIDNWDFIVQYLRHGEKDKLGRDPVVDVKGKAYNKTQIPILKKIHPGPFYIPKH